MLWEHSAPETPDVSLVERRAYSERLTLIDLKQYNGLLLTRTTLPSAADVMARSWSLKRAISLTVQPSGNIAKHKYFKPIPMAMSPLSS